MNRMALSLGVKSLDETTIVGTAVTSNARNRRGSIPIEANCWSFSTTLESAAMNAFPELPGKPRNTTTPPAAEVSAMIRFSACSGIEVDTNTMNCGAVPIGCNHLTMFIDVQEAASKVITVTSAVLNRLSLNAPRN